MYEHPTEIFGQEIPTWPGFFDSENTVTDVVVIVRQVGFGLEDNLPREEIMTTSSTNTTHTTRLGMLQEAMDGMRDPGTEQAD